MDVIAEVKRKPHHGIALARRASARWENALDEALKDTFRRPTRCPSSNRPLPPPTTTGQGPEDER